MNVRVRFAPSPTGALHIGSARTALFNWCFARHNGGKLVLRIEDTDATRSTKESVEGILDALRWLGLDWDEGPINQSSRQSFYRAMADRLISEGKAYPSDGAVRLRMPRDKIIVQDSLRGKIEFDRTLLEDLVLLKSDGSPTYNFAVVVDDSEMGITHVIRGEDILSNTPKQLAVYDALGASPPQWAHLPMILGEQGGKLSKRTGATSIQEFRDEGYAPEAMVNYLALLGWSPGGNRELLSRDELIQLFTLDRIGRSNARFNSEKLHWLNGQYIAQMSLERFEELGRPFLIRAGLAPETIDPVYLHRVLALVKPKIKLLVDVPEWTRYFFRDDFAYDEATAGKLLREKDAVASLELLVNRFGSVESFDPPHLESVVRALTEETKLPAGRFIHPCRAAVSGKTVGPGLFEMLAMLGKERSIARLKQAIKEFRK